MSDKERILSKTDAIKELRAVEQSELTVGRAFHMFRFKDQTTVAESLSDLRQIEATGLKMGGSFHAFRFNSADARELQEVEKESLAVGNAFHAFRFK